MPHTLSYYREALVHKSFIGDGQKHLQKNNERLEFLGDAILNAVVTEALYARFPKYKEGFLTNTRSKIVQRETLNRLATAIGLDKMIHSSHHSTSQTNNLGGNALEALVGAIFLDKGYEACRTFIITRLIARYIDLKEIARREVNFKSKVIEICQKYKFDFSFNLCEETVDSEHNPVFRYELVINSEVLGRGEGHSKKESQQSAAEKALKKLNKKSVLERLKLWQEKQEASHTPDEEAPVCP